MAEVWNNKSKVSTEAGIMNLEVSHYKGALLEVFLDGENKGSLSWHPIEKI